MEAPVWTLVKVTWAVLLTWIGLRGLVALSGRCRYAALFVGGFGLILLVVVVAEVLPQYASGSLGIDDALGGFAEIFRNPHGGN